MKSKKGFTLIEVILVLGITGLMFAGLVISTRHNIRAQRYSASVQDFDTLLRQIYNQVENVQITNRDSILSLSGSSNYCVIDGAINVTISTSTGNISKKGSKISQLATAGRTGCSVYGKLVTFGEGLYGLSNNAKKDVTAIHVYDVLGDVVDARNILVASSEKDAMREVHLGIIASRNGTRVTSYYTHTLDWGAWIETTTGSRMTGALLIVRSPLSGVIHTYYHSFSEYDIDIAKNYETEVRNAANVTSNIDGYNAMQLDFCVKSDDSGTLKRRNVRLNADARNASDIVVIEQDGGDNRC